MYKLWGEVNTKINLTTLPISQDCCENKVEKRLNIIKTVKVRKRKKHSKVILLKEMILIPLKTEKYYLF